MCKNLLSKSMYDYLATHVNEIQKEQEILFKELYAEETEESKNFEAFFKDYVATINHFLSKASVDKSGKNELPFVIIGSIVDVYDSDDMEECRYRIVLPYKKQQTTAIDCASCLSPLGKTLLFKSEKENVRVKIPTGELHYTIRKITIPAAADHGMGKKASGILNLPAFKAANMEM